MRSIGELGKEPRLDHDPVVFGYGWMRTNAIVRLGTLAELDQYGRTSHCGLVSLGPASDGRPLETDGSLMRPYTIAVVTLAILSLLSHALVPDAYS